MAYPDLKCLLWEAATAFQAGEDRRAVTLLARLRDSFRHGTLEWAQLERLHGLLLIHVQREVEGTFCLERADAALDALHAEKPGMDWLGADEGLSES